MILHNGMKDKVKAYKSTFSAVTQHRQPCRMKLVCG
ncbi:hypothetical protein ABIE12_003259 [Serratia sp. 509]